ncbi:AIPR family protein [Rossellomorea marisflavi]|uniref:AIPR family protein n=1 Tax=Rossellomorea marisflavi TaxID=189381 RepID=UPI0027A3C915|nr:AIPR family protein [Rossellomorea marisflavi]UTE72178.1 AIPR family protein [Rossellomorea marisflavi]
MKQIKKILLNAEYATEFSIDERKTIFMVVNTKELLNKEIPNDANTRNFTGDQNKAVFQMINTLRKTPESFRIKNAGIRMIASEVIRNDNMVELWFKDGEGICNGGHTFEVCKIFGNSNAYVYITVEINLPKEELVDVSVALNMSKRVEDYSIGEKIGSQKWIRETLPNESLKYKEGDEGDYHVTDVLKVANLFKVGKDKKYCKNSINSSLVRKTAIVRENNKNQPLLNTKYLLPDIWELYKLIEDNQVIQENLPNRFTLMKKEEMKPKLTQGMVILFIFGTRYMTEINKNNIPKWKEGYSVERALMICEKISIQISKITKLASFKDMSAEFIYKDRRFHDKVKRIFADELLSH